MVRAITTAIATLAIAAAGVACGESDDPPGPVKPAPIEFEQLSLLGKEVLRVSRDGRAVLKSGTGEAGNTAKRFRVPPARLAAVNSALAEASFESIPTEDATADPDDCNDCAYLTFRWRGHTVKRASVDVPEDLEPAVAELQAIIDSQEP